MRHAGLAASPGRPFDAPARLRTAISAWASCAAELGLAAVMVAGSLPMAPVLLLHAGIVAALAWFAWMEHRAGNDDCAWWLYCVATAGLGPVGAVGSLAVTPVLRHFECHPRSFQAWYDELFPDAAPSRCQALHQRAMLDPQASRDAISVASFSDVIASGSLEQKHAVIALIAAHFRPEFTAPLRSALNDPEPTVRVLAATAVTQIENRFLQASMAMERHLASSASPFGSTLELAMLYDDYANSGLLDADRSQATRQLALNLYRRCDQLRPGTRAVHNAIIRVLVRAGRQSDAIGFFEAVAQQGPPAPESIAWYLECLFEQRRLPELRRACGRYRAHVNLPPGLSERCRDAVDAWASGEPA